MLERKPPEPRRFAAEMISAWIAEDDADFERAVAQSLRPLSRAALLLLAACGSEARGGVLAGEGPTHFAERFGPGRMWLLTIGADFMGPAVYVVVAGHRRLAMRQNCGTPNAPRSVRALLPGAVSAALPGARSAS